MVVCRFLFNPSGVDCARVRFSCPAPPFVLSWIELEKRTGNLIATSKIICRFYKKKKATGVGRILTKSICRWPFMWCLWLNHPSCSDDDLIGIYSGLCFSPTMPSWHRLFNCPSILLFGSAPPVLYINAVMSATHLLKHHVCAACAAFKLYRSIAVLITANNVAAVWTVYPLVQLPITVLICIRME